MTQASEFNEQQFARGYPEGSEYHFWTMARVRLLHRLLLGHGAEKGRLMEVGCGRGYMVDGLRKLGLDCRGVEIAPIKVGQALEEFVCTGISAESLPAKEREVVNALLVLDVIEHLDEPVAFLRGLVKAFPSATTLLVTVPADMRLWSNYDTYYGHQKRYNRKTLGEELGGLGEILKLEPLFRSLYFLMWILVRIRGERAIHNAPPSVKLRPLHKILASWFVAESSLLRWLPLGTSLAAVVSLKRAPLRGL